MSTSTSETGHAINLANFQTLITYCSGYGATYNPVIDAIKIRQLQAKYDLASQKLSEAAAKKALLNTAVNERIVGFEGLEILCTKVTNAFAVSGATIGDIKDLQTINKKIQSPAKKKTPVSKEGTEGDSISTSQQSYDSKINFFINFIQFLEAKPTYEPNEVELKVPALQTKLEGMQEKNANYDNAFFNYNQQLNSRNNEMYNPTTGLVQASKDVKKYIRSVFGASSPQFKQLNSIEFKVLKN
jgi:ribosomal protein S11